MLGQRLMRTTTEFPRVLMVGVGVALAGGALLWYLTGGMRLFTTESWRRAAIAQTPRPLPELVLQDHNGRSLALRELCGKLMLIDFVYTQCSSVCRTLGATSSQLASRLAGPVSSGEVVILSVSFDPIRDTPQRMSEFKRGLEPHETGWTVARPSTAVDLLLNTLGVVVIPDGRGGFEHNAALHAVDRSCRVARVFDLEGVDDAEQWIRARL